MADTGAAVLKLTVLDESHLSEFKRRMQNAFQKGAEDVLGKINETVLPESDINASLSAGGSVAYAAYDGDKLVGGAIVVIDSANHCGDLHFLFVDVDGQNKGVGRFIWKEIENNHPDVKKWITHTPYFDKRNLHFYINSCGFRAVEFFSDRHKGEDEPTELDSKRGTDCMFRFEKTVND